MHKKYLGDSPQIKLTPFIQEIASSFQEQGLDLILEILKWMKNNLKESGFDEKIFRKRTAEEIIKSKIATGCTDYALVFIALSRAKNIPTKYVETVRRRWLDIGKEDEQIEGHIFAECFISDKWYIINPQEGAIVVNYGRYVIFKEGLDSWDIGIKSLDDLKKQFTEFKKEYKQN